MKNFLLVFSLIFLLISCKNQEKEDETEDIKVIEQESDDNNSSERNSPLTPAESSGERVSDHEESAQSPEDPGNRKSETSSTGQISNGKYIKEDESDASCNCYCVEVVFTGESELCLRDNEIYINARFSQNGNTTLVYFSEPSERNTNEELPWEDFDTNSPIAKITSTTKGMELDWKGFSIDGELAVDYAIYGKKSLEGSYKKQ